MLDREGSQGWDALSSKMGFLPASQSSTPDHSYCNPYFNLLKKIEKLEVFYDLQQTQTPKYTPDCLSCYKQGPG